MFHSLIPTLTLLILHFDGSLIPQISPLRPLASCSAVILHNNGTTLAIGGRVFLPSQIPSSSFTSAHAEYEGLTLGLRFLSSILLSNDDDNYFSVLNDKEYDNIAIRGDCKTVVNQLQGKSSPRKLKQEHDVVTSLLSSIIAKRQYSIDFIPRKKNERADAISRSGITALRHHLRSTLLHRSSSSSLRRDLSQRLDVLTTVATTTTAGFLPQQERIELLRDMGNEAREAKNVDVMSRVGDALRVEANRFSDFQKKTMKGRRHELWKQERDGIDMLGVRLQLEALRISEKDKEADILERKYRYRLGLSQKYEGDDNYVNRLDCMSDNPAESVSPSFEGDDNKEWLASKESWEKLAAEALHVSHVFEVNDDSCALCKDSGVWFVNPNVK